MKPEIDLDTIADFTWSFSYLFLLEVGGGDCYIWSDPDYPGGDNTIKRYEGDPKDFTMKGFSGRYKGKHRIGDYCGENVIFQLD